MTARLRAPGLYRAFMGAGLGVAFAYAVVLSVRSLYDFKPIVDGDAVTIVALLAAPFGFLFGLGAFDYWFYWASGRPTRPEDHSSHGARSWRDYFRVNTDHKVIGIQYTVTSFFFLLVGGSLAMLMRAELAQPGMQFVSTDGFNGLFSVHASILIFLFIIPVFAGLANFVLPLMIGAPDMAFPRLNAHRRHDDDGQLPGPRRLLRHGLDGLRPAVHGRAARPALLHRRRAVRGRLVGGHRPELPGDHHHHARAGHELLAHAPAGVGELLDLAAGGDRHSVHRSVAVLRAAGPGAGLQLLRARPGR